MNKRIHQIMKDSGMNQKEFSQATGIPTATLSNIFNGRTSATLNHAAAIHNKFPDLRTDWLIYGEGEMYVHKQDDAARVVAPTLFDLPQVTETPKAPREPATATPAEGRIDAKMLRETVREAVQEAGKQRRNVVEIRVFFDDGTYDVFRNDR